MRRGGALSSGKFAPALHDIGTTVARIVTAAAALVVLLVLAGALARDVSSK